MQGYLNLKEQSSWGFEFFLTYHQKQQQGRKPLSWEDDKELE